MSLLAILRAYTLREYGVVLAMAVLGGLGLVFMLSSMGGGAPAGETLLKRETAERKQTASLRFVEANAAAKDRARAAAARRAKMLAARRQVLAARAARRARAAARSAPARTAVRRTTPRVVTRTPTRVVNTAPAPSRPTPKPAPAPKPAPQQSGSGGGGSFDDSG
jgi:hypothetical protein